MPGPAGDSTGDRPVAFISHHSSQIGAARHLARVLERSGIKGWMAPDDIDPGMPFDKVIIEQIARSDVILLLFCSRSDQSKHVKREIMLAEQSSKLIYPIRLETIQPEGLAYWLQDYQWIDWLDQRDEAIERMVGTIRRQLSLPAQAVPPAEQQVAPPPGYTAPAVPPQPLQPGAASPPPPPPPAGGGAAPAHGFDTKAKVAVGAIAGVLVLAGLGALIESGSGGTEAGSASDSGSPGFAIRRGSDQAGGGASAAPSATPSYVSSIEPGMWESTLQVRGFTSNVPGLTREALGNLNSEQTSRDCISEDEARNPAKSLIDMAKSMEGNCTPANMNFSGGYISGRMSCTQGGGEVRSELDLGGSYTPSTIDLDFSVVQSAEQSGQSFEAKYTLHMASRRVGQCE